MAKALVKKEKEESTALTVVEFAPPIMMDEEFMSMMQEEMDGLSLEFTRVKFPGGGGLTFEVPGDDPDNPDIERELSGVIVDHHPCNVWWKEKYNGGNLPPDCSSLDGKIGVTAEGEQRPCATCEYNQPGSDPEGGRGKWCKNKRRLYLLPEDTIFPLLITLPTMSLKNTADYIAKRVLTHALRPSEVFTTVSLQKAVSSDGKPYSQATFRLVGVLSPEMRKAMKEFSAAIKPITRKLALSMDDYDIRPADSYDDEDTIEVSEEAPPEAQTAQQEGFVYDIPGTREKRTKKNKAAGGEDDPYFGTEPPF